MCERMLWHDAKRFFLSVKIIGTNWIYISCIRKTQKSLCSLYCKRAVEFLRKGRKWELCINVLCLTDGAKFLFGSKDGRPK